MTDDKPDPTPKDRTAPLGAVGVGAVIALFAGALLTSEDAEQHAPAAPQSQAEAETAKADPKPNEKPDLEPSGKPENRIQQPAEPPTGPTQHASVEADAATQRETVEASAKSAELATPEASPALARPVAATPTISAPQIRTAPPSIGTIKAAPSIAMPRVQPPPEIVVKFKDDTQIKPIADLFWKDKAAARAKFDALKARSPALKNLYLARVTYSGEVVLVHDEDMPADKLRRATLDAAARLKADPNISYAEPNATAQPGVQ
ncbi:MAG: hypothetical protein AAF719_14660 [Pseudomonadota bacterium]